MAIQETPNHKLRYPQGEDPAKHALYYENLAKDTERELDAIAPGQIVGGSAGQLLVVQNTGGAAFKALSGDVTISEAGVATIGTGKVTADKLGGSSVETGKVKDGAVTAGKLASSAVEEAKIKDGAVTEAKHADGSVTSRKAKLTAGVVEASESWALTLVYEDAPGASLEITPAVPSLLLVTAVFCFGWENADTQSAQGTISLDGVDQTSMAVLTNTVPGATGADALTTVPQVYSLSLSAAKHTVKMRARRVAAGPAAGVLFATERTRFIYQLVAQ